MQGVVHILLHQRGVSTQSWRGGGVRSLDDAIKSKIISCHKFCRFVNLASQQFDGKAQCRNTGHLKVKILWFTCSKQRVRLCSIMKRCCALCIKKVAKCTMIKWFVMSSNTLLDDTIIGRKGLQPGDVRWQAVNWPKYWWHNKLTNSNPGFTKCNVLKGPIPENGPFQVSKLAILMYWVQKKTPELTENVSKSLDRRNFL